MLGIDNIERVKPGGLELVDRQGSPNRAFGSIHPAHQRRANHSDADAKYGHCPIQYCIQCYFDYRATLGPA